MRRFVLASAIAVVLTAAFLPGAGLGSPVALTRAEPGMPAGLAGAIHARFGAGAIRAGWAAQAAQGPGLGFSVALSADGTTALVGAPGAGSLSTVFGTCCKWRNGAAYVFHVSSAGSWESTGTPVATLRPGRREPFGTGWNVALSDDGTTAFVSARSDGARGVIYVFHASAENAWKSAAKPKATLTVAASDSSLGPLAVSSDGTTVVADAPYANEFGGTAFVFHAASEGAWATRSAPTATLTNEAGGGGVAISGDGTTVLLSDYGNYEAGGGASIYHVSAEDAWTDDSTPNAVLSDSSITGEYSWFGGSLALSGDGTVALASTSAGTVDVFHAASADAWATTYTPTAILSNAGGSPGDYFGGGVVALSSDGTTALVDAPGLAKRGGSFIFHASGEGAWATTAVPDAKLSTPHVTGTLEEVGALSADGATALLGAPDVNWGTGEADLFHSASPSSWITSSKPTAKLTNSAFPKPACVVPRLRGQLLAQARDTLDFTNCRLGKVTKVHSTRKNRGRVVSQSPAPKRHLRPGSKINVKVGK